MADPQTDRSSAATSGSFSLLQAQDTTPLASWHLLAIVLTATFIAYARTLSFDFVHDDFIFLVNNPAIHSWRYLTEYFMASVWEGVYPGVPGNYYRPVFLLWARLNDAMFGSQAGMWHLTTLATHLVATALAYFLALRLIENRLAAGMAALVFGLHPVHIEAVAWVSGVTEPLLGVFFIGAFLCYLKMRDGGGKAHAWLIAAIFLYILGLLEKETEILLPAIVCVYEWSYGTVPTEGNAWRVRCVRAWRALRAAAPFILVTIPYLIARIAVLKGFSHPSTMLPLQNILFTWPSLIWFWIRHLVAPVGLGTFYNLRTVDQPGWANFLLPAVAAATAAALLIWGASRSRAIFFAAALIVLPLLPFFDLRMFHHNNFAQDRFLYLPSLGLALMVGIVFRKIPSGHTKLFGLGAAQALCPLALAFLLGLGTWHESFYFENNWIFYRYNYLLAPRNAYAANDYGVILELLGMKAEALKVLEQAAADDPEYRSAAYNLGCLYYEEGRLELAQRYLTKAIQIDPALSDAYFCLGLTALEAGQAKQAEQAFRTALRIKPQGKEYHYRLGLALEAEGDLKGALAQYQAELATNSTHPYARQHARDIQSRLAAAGPLLTP